MALVFRGDRGQRESADIENTRLAPVARALADVGLAAEAAVFDENMADDLGDQLLGVSGALVWVDPVTGHQDRTVLDSLLRDVAAAGVCVSAHPDVILKMGTKQVLYDTRELDWVSDVRLYRTADEFCESFPDALRKGAARVLKQYRGNGGIGVWKVQRAAATRDRVVVQSARARDERIEEMPLPDFLARCRKYFEYGDGDGRLVDQPFESRILEGITRCYLVANEVVGFCRQYAAEGSVPDRVFGLPSAKTMYPPDEPAFAALRDRVERDWVPAMQRIVGVASESLPALWDADFLFGAKTPDGRDTYVLSEINTSAVAPFPADALPVLARRVRTMLDGAEAPS